MAAVVAFGQRRDTAAAWTAANSKLEDGQYGVETDTGRQKIGDASGTLWNSLPYLGFSIAEAASLGAAPSYIQFKRLTGVPNKLYVSLEGTAGWNWILVASIP